MFRYLHQLSNEADTVNKNKAMNKVTFLGLVDELALVQVENSFAIAYVLFNEKDGVVVEELANTDGLQIQECTDFLTTPDREVIVEWFDSVLN